MILSGAPLRRRSFAFLYPLTRVLILFLYDVKSRVAITSIFDFMLYSNENALALSFGFPLTFSAKTFKAASVGSPTFLKSPSTISILAVLLKTHPTVRACKRSCLLALGYFA